ncbi:IMP cyclohydrolase [Lacticaseibacillus rhamnosus]|nr:IMP cyclohydrolase [Lacticaseibacillus rhamnosus]
MIGCSGWWPSIDTRFFVQKLTCKDIERNGKDRAIMLKAAYTLSP